jgi:hypothetical protein
MSQRERYNVFPRHSALDSLSKQIETFGPAECTCQPTAHYLWAGELQIAIAFRVNDGDRKSNLNRSFGTSHACSESDVRRESNNDAQCCRGTWRDHTSVYEPTILT